jgi:heterotetrameric sarcosine oxidase delta subunit
MIMLPCPWCGARDSSEFRYAGEVTARPDPNTASVAQWRDYLYLRDNPCGWVTERWYHRAGCRQYFVIDRDTRTDQIRAPEPGR